ncbi:MAG: NAD-glutamate dehydrogenase [Porticoccaceae bacterium]
MAEQSLRSKLVKWISAVADQRLSKEESTSFKDFVERVIHVHPDESLLRWSKEDNFGAVYGLYSFAKKRTADKPLLKVFNPDLENDGWVSKHSLIYFCQKDMPFLVESLRMALNRLQLQIHLFESNVLWVRRDAKGNLLEVTDARQKDSASESLGYIQIDSSTDPEYLGSIHDRLLEAFLNVDTVVSDFAPMIERVNQCIDELDKIRDVDPEEIEFLRWLRDGNFTFLGMSEFRLKKLAQGTQIEEQQDERLGLMKNRTPLEPKMLDQLCDGFAGFYRETPSLAFTKASQKSSVHRDVYSDYVIVKRYNKKGEAIGETRMLGLYTSRLYHYSTGQIPLLRSKGQWLVDHSELDDSSHNGKTFAAILESHPRDELIQASLDESLQTILGIWKIYERRTIRLFLRVDRFEKFVSCIVYLPREMVRAEIRRKIERILGLALDSDDFEAATQFLSESVLARVHMVFRITNQAFKKVSRESLEAEIIEQTRDWAQRFAESCLEHFGDEQGRRLIQIYQYAFPGSYRDRYSPLQAVHDLDLVRNLAEEDEISLCLFHEPGAPEDELRLKLFHLKNSLELSNIIPLLENLGSRVLVEHPFRLQPHEKQDIWVHDFTLRQALPKNHPLDISAVRQAYHDAFRAVWLGQAESDGFNRLVFSARIDWRTVALLRAYARYLKQLGLPFSFDFIAHALGSHLNLCRELVALFHCYFDPRRQEKESHTRFAENLTMGIKAALDEVDNLNEDQVLRSYMDMINATLRTNFFCRDSQGNPPPTIAFKVNTKQLEFAPEPRPEYETYVYSPRVEGVHLRGGKVARGGIRWSDRQEDFRTEVLGLVKAQQVKNAVIVPTGAKGGFVARNAFSLSSREEFLQEGEACYRLFIEGLFDLVDNRVGDDVVPPEQVIRRDDDDPYLVVAADKGTATFSDIANEISQRRHFWLGDAFASGGSQGYDHKAMGITARGGWVAVQRHFRELGRNIQEEPFSVIGIGDMAGDVFGNAMLLSRQIKLVAAFNHQHIFIDPNPDTETSWQERKRLFDLPRSSWEDYSSELISKGGGIYKRSAKSIQLSAETRKALGIDQVRLTPNELIHLLLKAPVDLIWNGGIGTYVKSLEESHGDVGDRTNDSLRVNGADLRCRVFGEGGNLGMTQLGRMEFCRKGGICNTDFIDNSAGVDCSDHEVNIKILLNADVEAENLTGKQRNQLLRKMTDEVAEMVLDNNYRQTLAISLAESRKTQNHYDYFRFMQYLEETGHLNRSLEFLPDEETLRDLHSSGKSWTRPELAILVSYAKVVLKQELLDDSLVDDSVVTSMIYDAFPESLQKQYSEAIKSHRLCKEIIATQLANRMVNRMGFSYCQRQNLSLGASSVETARAFVTVMELLGLHGTWESIEDLDYKVPADIQYELFYQVMRLGRRASRWFLRAGMSLKPEQVIKRMKPGFELLMPRVVKFYRDSPKESLAIQKRWIKSGVPEELAFTVGSFDACFLLPGIVDTALSSNNKPEDMLDLRFQLGQELALDWLMQQTVDWQPENQWQDLARESNVDDLEYLGRQLTLGIHNLYPDLSGREQIDHWKQENPLKTRRFINMVNSLKSVGTQDISVFIVALRELKDLVDSSF